jgi:hypothetical protein
MPLVVSEEQLNLLQRQLERERIARRQAENIAEQGILRLYERQQLDRLLRTSAEASALAETPVDALRTVMDALGSYLQWPLGHAFLVADLSAGKRLAHAHITWGTATAELADFDRRLSAVKLRMGEGLLGRVWKTRSAAPGWRRSLPSRSLSKTKLSRCWRFSIGLPWLRTKQLLMPRHKSANCSGGSSSGNVRGRLRWPPTSSWRIRSQNGRPSWRR